MAYLYITYGRTEHIYNIEGWKRSSQFMQSYINNFMGSPPTLIIFTFLRRNRQNGNIYS